MRFFIMVCLSFLSIACIQNENSRHEPLGREGISYAQTLRLQSLSTFTLIEVSKPWQKGESESFVYIAADSATVVPDSLLHLPVIKVPVRSAITFSTTHIGFISALGQTQTIKGVSGKDYFFDTEVRKRFNQGLVFDIGYSPAIDYETIIKINPDVVFLYGLGASEAVIVNRLASAGLATIMVSEFLEHHPLGKAEWIKLFACLYGLEDTGDSIFTLVSNNYNELIPVVRDKPSKPKVLTGLPWKGTWYLAGGRSFMARLMEDAGGDYLWKDNTSEEFIPLSTEAVFSRAGDADVWINTGTAVSLNDLVGRDKRFENLKPIHSGSVFNNTARLNASGGNDYWESGTLRPDLVLRDLISIFHPGLLEEEELVYYKKLEYE